MDVSNCEVEPGGHELIEAMVSLTGLPEEWVRKELDQILKQFGQNPTEMTLQQLREVLAAYLETLQNDLLSS